MPCRRGASSKRASSTAVQTLGLRGRPPELRNHPSARQHASQAGTPLLGTTLSLPLQARHLPAQAHVSGTHLSHPTHLTRMTRRILCLTPLLVVFDETIGLLLSHSSHSSHRVVSTVLIPFTMLDLAAWHCPVQITTTPSLAAATRRAMRLCPVLSSMAPQGSQKDLAPCTPWVTAFCSSPSPMAPRSRRQDLPSRMPRAMTFCLSLKAASLKAT